MPVKKEAVEAAGGEEGLWAATPELAITNGPFKLTEYTIGEGLKLEANENYWNKKEVGLSVINVKFIDDENTAYQAYQSGELDFIPSVPTAEVPKLIAEDPNFYVFPLLGTYYYNFNMDLDIWSDVRVRKAMAMAIDREVICETLGAGQVPAAGFVPPGFIDDKGNDFFETAGTYGLATDDSKVAEAQALMAEAGYPNGEGFPEFVMMYNTSEGHQTIAELIQEMFKTNLGITCTLENQEWAVFQDTRTQGDYELARGGWLTDFMDPMGMLGIFKNLDVAYNDPNYYNAEFERLINEASSATSKEAHFEALYAAQDIFMNDMPIIPVYHYSDTMLVSDKVEGWDRSVLGGLDFSSATISE
jgi:oligopeptide transport system substrate-binding protein